MSGPVSSVDVTAGLAPSSDAPVQDAAAPQVTEARTVEVGGLPVRRALPGRARRTVGAWCFVDHLGPTAVLATRPVEIGPHPHIGLATVTWLVSGCLVHLDSLGSDQVLRPGQLNLMTAGNGVAHAEVSGDGPGAPGSGAPGPGELHGVQMWIAQPEGTRHGPSAFAHHADLPAAEFGAVEATVLLGELGGVTSPARTDTPLVGAELAPRGNGVIPLRSSFEHALVVLTGAVRVGDRILTPGRLGYLGAGRAELDLGGEDGTRAMLLGGEPFTEPLVMWWNLVARSRAEIEAARDDWQAGTDRFGSVATTVARTVAPRPPWSPG
ncbi:pirin family protein [Frankia sp. AgB32]|uniref:pirin family protein n=1 Tax=Frankia sp. AgB32 TaxID=631119 RepID=UPI00200D9031|nr:pirin family protein [Frankia sp. AgB32]MCK9894753.1 pirin family protein [Frankia sp. AgB32]